MKIGGESKLAVVGANAKLEQLVGKKHGRKDNLDDAATPTKYAPKTKRNVSTRASPLLVLTISLGVQANHRN